MAEKPPASIETESEVEVAHLRGGQVGRIEADFAHVHQGAAREIAARQVEIDQSAAALVSGNAVAMQLSSVLAAQGESVQADRSAIVGLQAKEIDLKSSRVGLSVAGRTKMTDSSAVFLLAGKVEGPVSTVFDTRGSLLAGLTGGIALGLVMFVTRLLRGRR